MHCSLRDEWKFWRYTCFTMLKVQYPVFFYYKAGLGAHIQKLSLNEQSVTALSQAPSTGCRNAQWAVPARACETCPIRADWACLEAGLKEICTKGWIEQLDAQKRQVWTWKWAKHEKKVRKNDCICSLCLDLHHPPSKCPINLWDLWGRMTYLYSSLCTKTSQIPTLLSRANDVIKSQSLRSSNSWHHFSFLWHQVTDWYEGNRKCIEKAENHNKSTLM